MLLSSSLPLPLSLLPSSPSSPPRLRVAAVAIEICPVAPEGIVGGTQGGRAGTPGRQQDLPALDAGRHQGVSLRIHPHPGDCTSSPYLPTANLHRVRKQFFYVKCKWHRTTQKRPLRFLGLDRSNNAAHQDRLAECYPLRGMSRTRGVSHY
jgi:hypothetical protein